MKADGLAVQDIVEEVWREVLQQREIDRDRSFVELGGTSIAAAKMATLLGKRLGRQIPVAKIFEHPTLRQLTRFLQGSGAETESPVRPAVRGAAQPGRDVAIVGMACRFPGADTLEEFWANLLSGKDTIRILAPEELGAGVPEALKSDPRYVRARGLIREPYGFDADFFDISPMEAKLIDPQQRLMLEVAWEALESSGNSPESNEGRIAVFTGIEDNSYYKNEILPYPDAERRAGRFAIMTGNEKDFVSMRIAHKLNLKGPAVSVHTACSTSLVAVIMAMRSLRQGECEVAIAGGASIHFPSDEGYYFQEGGVFSPDGRCRPFDRDAQGTNFTDGCGAVVLKRLEDAIRDRDTIYAVLKGGAINNDGGEKASFSAPSVAGQSACIAEAHADGGVDPRTIQYVEAHGTATPVGDPIEVEALTRAFRWKSGDPRGCHLGSVKGNIGHTTAAAGVAGLIKTALALKHRVIPPTVHFKKPNPDLQLERTPFRVVDRAMEWGSEAPRRAAVSSFGIGGTNSHVVLEEAPESVGELLAADPRPFEILPVSAKTASQRDRLLESLSSVRADARDAAFTLQNGRARFGFRGARVRLCGIDGDEIRVTRDRPVEAPRLAFLFPGQGAQYIGMGKGLHELFPEFRETFDRCCELLSEELKVDFRSLIFDPSQKQTLENTRYTQPALFAIEISIARMLAGWGILPDLMIGHSVGEFAAACLAGVFTLEEGIRLICARGRLMSELPPGRMLSVRGPIEEIVKVADGEVDVASINSPVHVVLAGSGEKIQAVQARIEKAGFQCRVLHTSHAFHSGMMSPVVEPFRAIVAEVALKPPSIPILSTVTAEPLGAANATDPGYWAGHLRKPVNFSGAALAAIAAGANVFMEIGPRATLSTLVLQQLKGKDGLSVATLGDSPEASVEVGVLGTALAKLWTAGIELPWNAIWQGGSRVPILPYPFERKEYRFSENRKPETRASALSAPVLVEAPAPATRSASATALASVPVSAEDPLLLELGDLIGDHLGTKLQSPTTTFVESGLDSLLMMQIGVEIGMKYGVAVSLRELMGAINCLKNLAEHIRKNAAPERLARLAQASAGQPAREARAPSRDDAPAGISGDALKAIQAQLARIQETVDLQGKLLASLSLQAAATGAPHPQNSVVRPLIRAKHQQPPAAGAFLAQTPDGRLAWFRFNRETERYEMLQ